MSMFTSEVSLRQCSQRGKFLSEPLARSRLLTDLGPAGATEHPEYLRVPLRDGDGDVIGNLRIDPFTGTEWFPPGCNGIIFCPWITLRLGEPVFVVTTAAEVAAHIRANQVVIAAPVVNRFLSQHVNRLIARLEIEFMLEYGRAFGACGERVVYT